MDFEVLVVESGGRVEGLQQEQACEEGAWSSVEIGVEAKLVLVLSSC